MKNKEHQITRPVSASKKLKLQVNPSVNNVEVGIWSVLFLPGESQGWRSLVGSVRTESETTEAT